MITKFAKNIVNRFSNITIKKMKLQKQKRESNFDSMRNFLRKRINDR